MPPINIRPEVPTDAPAVEAVPTAAFMRAPHPVHTEQYIVAALRGAGALTVSLVGDSAYYRRFGFETHPSLTLPNVPAEVTFHPAFMATG